MKYYLIIFFLITNYIKSNILNEKINYSDLEHSGTYSIFNDVTHYKSYVESNKEIYINTTSNVLTSNFTSHFNQFIFMRLNKGNFYINIPINRRILFKEEKSIILNKFSFSTNLKVKKEDILFSLELKYFGYLTLSSGISMNSDILINTNVGYFSFKVYNIFSYIVDLRNWLIGDIKFLYEDSAYGYDEYINYNGKFSNDVNIYYKPNIKIGYCKEFSGIYFDKIRIALEINNLLCNNPFLEVYYKDYSISRKIELGLELVKDFDTISLNIRFGVKNLRPIFRLKGLLFDVVNLEYHFSNISIDDLNRNEKIKYFHIFSMGFKVVCENRFL